jgi:hypothetical protein
MNELLISNIASAFNDRENPILIFCKWEDALKIQEDITKKNALSTGFEFKMPPKNLNCNFFSCMYEGKTFIFIDERQKIEFLELLKGKV